MGLQAWFERLVPRKSGTAVESSTFPVEVFWRSVCSLKQPVLLVTGASVLKVLAATEEAHALLGCSNAAEISNLVHSGLDPHTLSRIQIAVANPGNIVNDLPIRMQTSDNYVTVNVSVSALPEYPEKNAALLFLKDSKDSLYPAWSSLTRDLLSVMPHPCWVVDAAGSTVFSNAAFGGSPMDVLRARTSASQSRDLAELEQLGALRADLKDRPAQVRNGDSIASHIYDLGVDGRWDVLHFPLTSRDGEGFVGVMALSLEPREGMRYVIQNGALGKQELQRMLAVKEAERTMLAREIHDSLGQQFTVLKLAMRRLDKLVLGSNTASAEAVQQFQSVRALVDSLAKAARRIAFEMREDNVTLQGLAHSIHELVSDLRTRLGIQIQFELAPGFVEPEQKLAQNMHRSVQELLNNVSKHAKASRCLVRMGLDENTYWLEVQDNGVGMPSHLKTRSMGLRSMKERADLYGGKVIFTTRPDVEGTLARMELPERRIPPAGVPAGE
jgi:signal transduction histidine kinase